MDVVPPSTSNGAINLWDRMAGEGCKAFRGFTLYKDQGSERSLMKVGRELHISTQAVGKWSSQWHWVSRCQAWDNHQARTVNLSVLSMLVRQAQQLQRKANEALETITKGDNPTIPELCLMLRTVVSLAQCANGANSVGLNESGFPAELKPPVFSIVAYSKPEDHCWVRHEEDTEGKKGFHIPLEIAPPFQKMFPQFILVF